MLINSIIIFLVFSSTSVESQCIKHTSLIDFSLSAIAMSSLDNTLSIYSNIDKC